jgi:hypothetical protein
MRQHGAERRRKDGSGVMKKSQRAQSEDLQESFCNNVIRCNIADVKVNAVFCFRRINLMALKPFAFIL